MSPRTPWDELSALLASPGTLPPAPSDATAQLPTHFIAALRTLHARSPPSPSRAPPPPPLAPAVATLLAHFRRLLSSPAQLRAALAGPSHDHALHLADPAARAALARLLPALARTPYRHSQRCSHWLDKARLHDDLVRAGDDTAEQALHALQHVYHNVEESRQKVKADMHVDTDRPV